MSIDIDQATVDRWLAAGTWMQFAPGELQFSPLHGDTPSHTNPPADWEADQKCETCHGRGRLACRRCGGFDGWWLQNDGHNDVERVYCGRHLIIATCPDCNGTGLRRHPVTVPCPVCDGDGAVDRLFGADCTRCSTYPYVNGPARSNGRITIAWATVEWGPLRTFGEDDLDEPPEGWVTVYSDGGVEVWLPHDDPECPWLTDDLTLPPGLDPQSLDGRWARGGSITKV